MELLVCQIVLPLYNIVINIIFKYICWFINFHEDTYGNTTTTKCAYCNSACNTCTGSTANDCLTC